MFWFIKCSLMVWSGLWSNMQHHCSEKINDDIICHKRDQKDYLFIPAPTYFAFIYLIKIELLKVHARTQLSSGVKTN